MSTLHFITNPKFFVKDGNLYYLPNVPEKPKRQFVDNTELNGIKIQYQQALQKAKDNGVEVGNEYEVVCWLINCNSSEQVKKKGAVHTLTGKYEVEIKELCAHDSCPDDAGCDHCKEPKKLAFIKQQEERKDFTDRYKRIAESDHFKKAYDNKSIGEQQEVEQKLFDKVLKSVPQEVKDEVDKQMKEVEHPKLRKEREFVAPEKPFIQELYADNGALCGYSLIDPVSGETLWTDDDEEQIKLDRLGNTTAPVFNEKEEVKVMVILQRYQAGMSEYFRMHDYRNMYSLWEQLLVEIKQSLGRIEPEN